jgi:prevent-host-death family protein
MESLSANEAKTHFGDLLLKVQREPIQINRNGKAIAVVLSVNDYLNLESLKMLYLKTRVEQAKEDIAAGRIVDGDVFFDDLFHGKFD